MAKKKNVKQQQQQISPERYIKTKARSLPIGDCLIRREWKELGLAIIFVPRMHKQGNITFGYYLVDTFCLGVKNCSYKFNCLPDEYEDIISRVYADTGYDVISYEEAHNLIYGAIEYAEDLGFSSHKDFAVAQYILEEDTEDIPLIEYEFGKDDKPFLVVMSKLEASKYLPILNKNVGEGNYEFLIPEEDYDGYDDYESYEEYDEE